MRKLMALTLAGAMMLSLAACGSEKKNDSTKVNVMLRQDADEESIAMAVKKRGEEGKEIDLGKNLFVDTLNEALMMLSSEKASLFITNTATAKYLAARDNSLTAIETDSPVTLHILMMSENAQLKEKLDSVISDMKENGVLDTLYREYVTDIISGGEPKTIELPVYDGADTITIGVSGDIPPIDYVNTDGEPVGYNMAVLAEIAKQLECNIDVVVIDGGTRFTALSSGKVDAFFWQTNDDGTEMSEGQTTYTLSDSYAELYAGGVTKK